MNSPNPKEIDFYYDSKKKKIMRTAVMTGKSCQIVSATYKLG